MYRLISSVAGLKCSKSRECAKSKNPKSRDYCIFTQKILNQEPKIGALNPNSVLCTDQAPSPAFSALNPGSALNPRTLNPGTTVVLSTAGAIKANEFVPSLRGWFGPYVIIPHLNRQELSSMFLWSAVWKIRGEEKTVCCKNIECSAQLRSPQRESSKD